MISSGELNHYCSRDASVMRICTAQAWKECVKRRYNNYAERKNNIKKITSKKKRKKKKEKRKTEYSNAQIELLKINAQ